MTDAERVLKIAQDCGITPYGRSPINGAQLFCATSGDLLQFVAAALEAGRWRTDALRDVVAERERQISKEGWSPAHDDEHDAGEMAVAAACYALSATWLSHVSFREITLKYWPWENKWWKPKDPRRDLVRAGALILAEIERIDRAALPAPPKKEDV